MHLECVAELNRKGGQLSTSQLNLSVDEVATPPSPRLGATARGRHKRKAEDDHPRDPDDSKDVAGTNNSHDEEQILTLSANY